MKFELTKEEEHKLKEWQEKIKDIFGKYGHYDYIFTPYGIDISIVVRSHLTNTKLELN